MLKKILYINILLMFILFPALSFAQGFTLQKSITPSFGFLGDTVNFCLTIQPEAITSGTKADIVWVIDTTASMLAGINKVKSNITSLTSELASRGIDYRQGLVMFKDTYAADPVLNSGFASDDAQFITWINAIVPDGGGDDPESALEGLISANGSSWRSDASKSMILVTDAAVKCLETGDGDNSLTFTAHALKNNGIKIHSICNDLSPAAGNPRIISTLTNGAWLPVTASASAWQVFLSSLCTKVESYTNVIVRDPLPSGLTSPGAACGATLTGNELSWSIPAVWSDETYPLCCFPVVITSFFSGNVSNTAYVSSDSVTETASNETYLFFATPTVTQTITQTSTITPTITPTAPAVELKWTGAFPNPSAMHSRIIYRLSTACAVKITVYTVSGEIVKEASADALEGQNNWNWDLKNKAGIRCANGVYIIRIYAYDAAYKKEHEVWGKVSAVK